MWNAIAEKLHAAKVATDRAKWEALGRLARAGDQAKTVAGNVLSDIGRAEMQRAETDRAQAAAFADLIGGGRSADKGAGPQRKPTSIPTAAQPRTPVARQTARPAGEPKPTYRAALFGDHPYTEERPPQAPIDYGLIDERKRRMDAEIQQQMDAALASGMPEAVAGVWPAAIGRWVNRVQPKGEWDDKAHQPRDALSYERRGNYNYGATARYLGLPETVALRAAGLVQRLSNGVNVYNRDKITPSVGQFFYPTGPFGDDPRDQRDIKDAYR